MCSCALHANPLGIHAACCGAMANTGDVLVVAGDTELPSARDARRFNKWLVKLPHAHKIVGFGCEVVGEEHATLAAAVCVCAGARTCVCGVMRACHPESEQPAVQHMA